jgi:hypothetical protein
LWRIREIRDRAVIEIEGLMYQKEEMVVEGREGWMKRIG